MSKAEKFNDILKDKFDNWEHPVDETNWKDMRKMIDDSRRNKRRWAVAAMLFLGLMIAGGVYTYSTLNNNNKNQVVSTTSDKRSVSGTEMNSNTTTSTSSVNKNNVSDNKTTGIDNQSATATQSNLLPQTSKAALKSATLRMNKPSHLKNGVQSATIARDEDIVTNKDLPKSVTSITPININSINTVSNSTIGSIVKGESNLNTIGTNNGLSDNLTAGHVGKRNIFSVELGIGFSWGWVYNGDTSQGHGMNPMGGLGFTHKFNPKWAIKTGLQLSTLTNMNTTSYTVSHAGYDPNYKAFDTTFTTNWLYYATIPLQAEYTLNRDEAIGAGGTFSYLFAQYGNMVAYNLSLTQGTEITHQGKQFMDLQGYSKYNSSVYIFYKRHLFNKFSVYFNIYCGLNDIKNNTFFMQSKFERDYGAKVLFSYSIF